MSVEKHINEHSTVIFEPPTMSDYRIVIWDNYYYRLAIEDKRVTSKSFFLLEGGALFSSALILWGASLLNNEFSQIPGVVFSALEWSSNIMFAIFYIYFSSALFFFIYVYVWGTNKSDDKILHGKTINALTFLHKRNKTIELLSAQLMLDADITSTYESYVFRNDELSKMPLYRAIEEANNHLSTDSVAYSQTILFLDAIKDMSDSCTKSDIPHLKDALDDLSKAYLESVEKAKKTQAAIRNNEIDSSQMGSILEGVKDRFNSIDQANQDVMDILEPQKKEHA